MVAARSKGSTKHAAEPPPDAGVYTYLTEGDACSFQIPIEKVPLVIGKQGKKINSLQEQHGVKITLPGREEEGVGTIKITGRGVDAAMKAIIEAVGPVQELQVLENEASRVVEMEGKAGPGAVSFTINPEKGSLIIGKGGATMKTLAEEYKVSIKLPGKDFKGTKAMVMVKGDEPAGALQAISELVGGDQDVNWMLEAKAPAEGGGAKGGGKGKGGRGGKGGKGGKSGGRGGKGSSWGQWKAPNSSAWVRPQEADSAAAGEKDSAAAVSAPAAAKPATSSDSEMEKQKLLEKIGALKKAKAH